MKKTDEKGRFVKGTSGRPPGAKNIVNRTVKETVLEVFNKLQDGGPASLEKWAKEEPTEFYKIASKLIPTEVSQQVEVTGGVQIYIPDNKRDEKDS